MIKDFKRCQNVNFRQTKLGWRDDGFIYWVFRHQWIRNHLLAVVLLHDKNKVASEEPKVEDDDKCGNCGNLLKKVMLLENEFEKFKRKDRHHEKTDKSGAFFDAIFNDVEAQHSCDSPRQT